MLELLAVLMMYGTDSLSAAAAEASSPSGLKMRWTPTGAIASGYGSLVLMCWSSVERSGSADVLTRRLGTMDHFVKASTFFFDVSPVPALPET